LATMGALVMVVVAVFVFKSIYCTISPPENLENITNPVEQNLASATMSIGGLLPFALILILAFICWFFIRSSKEAFGGPA